MRALFLIFNSIFERERMKDPVRVTITGAAGQIGYALLFRVASGAMLGNVSRSSYNCLKSLLH